MAKKKTSPKRIRLVRKRKKRLVVISDLHAGHLAGLTPPYWHESDDVDTYRGRLGIQQRLMWNWYVNTLRELRPIDILAINGDAIEGKGGRSGGTELISTDRDVQCDIAACCIEEAKCKHIVMTYGSAYHTGFDEDWENNVALRVKADKIGSHEWIDVNGCVFDFKHFVGSSAIPHGRATAMIKEKLWNDQWYLLDEQQPNADVIVRSHVHYYGNFENSRYRAITTPALQGHGSKFGSRKCSGVVDIGLMWFDIETNGEYECHKRIAELTTQKAVALKY